MFPKCMKYLVYIIIFLWYIRIYLVFFLNFQSISMCFVDKYPFKIHKNISSTDKYLSKVYKNISSIDKYLSNVYKDI